MRIIAARFLQIIMYLQALFFIWIKDYISGVLGVIAIILMVILILKDR